MARETENIQISFIKRVKAQLSAYTIAAPGVPVDTKPLAKWMEPQIITRQAADTRSGYRNETYLCQINLYARTSPGQARLRVIDEMVDAVISAFDRVTFSLQDWAEDADPVIGYLVCSPVSFNDVPVRTAAGETATIRQINCTFTVTLNG